MVTTLVGENKKKHTYEMPMASVRASFVYGHEYRGDNAVKQPTGLK